MSLDTGKGGRLRLVTDVLRSFADATTDYERLLQTIVERVSELVGHACSVRLLSADGQKLVTAALHDPQKDPIFAQRTGVPIPVSGPLRNALDQQRAYVEEIVSQKTLEEVHPDAVGPPIVIARVLVAPLIARGAALGCLFVVQRAADAEPFTNDDVELVDALAHHAALALANSQLMVSLEEVERARVHERSILDTVAAPLLLIGADGRIVHVNRAFSQMFDVEQTAAIGQPVLVVANRAFDTHTTRDLFAELPPSSPQREGIEVVLATPSGERTFLLRTKKTFRPGNGSETTLITLVDLTDRKAAAVLARRQSLLIASMSEALIGLDRDFIVEDWNPAAERLFGWTADEARGRPVGEIFVHTSNNDDREGNRKRLREGNTLRAKMQIRNRSGIWVDVEFSTMPVSEGGEVRGYVCVMLDVTERTRLEAELRARVEDLTTANKELESFSYSVSHDLRAPVRAIDGFSEILEAEHGSRLDPEGHRVLELVRRNAKRMGLLIDDLLALAHFSRQAKVDEIVDMGFLARTSLAETLRAEPGRTIAATFEALPTICGDESLLRQVWLNLYANAVKYTRGRAQTAIETYATETADEVVYVVKDNGAGFDMRHADKLFGTFERLHTAKEFEGTGIGLALVARIIERHGGRVWGLGEVDRGATFSFALPKKKETS